ncbi:hypothetical protein [Bacillus benzoevorans]|uniref:Flagellar motor protein MotB n=1 Tax=Bacillus benzoevorans TaxID=1456 RepID=A0A7X0HQM1_9BACI|nr:hypothetical protein [Bacillus benzoevorans]MBB6445148.1 flagellar motor protein MotB [Bacillus benzoevorans]
MNFYPYQPRYYQHPGNYLQSYYQPVYWQWQPRPMQPVDGSVLSQSANQTKKLMKDASKVLDKLAQSKEFNAKLMAEAQASHKAEVEKLIRSIGVTSDLAVRYTPDGLRIQFSSAIEGYDCCKLTISLRWK